MNQHRIVRSLIATLLVGLLSLGGLVAYTLIIADMGQKTLEQVAPGSSVPPASAFYDQQTFRTLAPWFFVLGFVSTLVPALSRRR
ncbi:MAG: hypothetical protein V4702_02655 [Patescibacteria group bacterium]